MCRVAHRDEKIRTFLVLNQKLAVLAIEAIWLGLWVTTYLIWKFTLKNTVWFTEKPIQFLLLGRFFNPKNDPQIGPKVSTPVSCFTLWNDLIFRLHINQKWTAAKPRRFQSTWGCAKTAENCNLCLLSKLVLYPGWTIEVVKRKQLFFSIIFQNVKTYLNL